MFCWILVGASTGEFMWPSPKLPWPLYPHPNNAPSFVTAITSALLPITPAAMSTRPAKTSHSSVKTWSREVSRHLVREVWLWEDKLHLSPCLSITQQACTLYRTATYISLPVTSWIFVGLNVHCWLAPVPRAPDGLRPTEYTSLSTVLRMADFPQLNT